MKPPQMSHYSLLEAGGHATADAVGLVRVADLEGHVIADAITVKGATVTEAGVVAAAPLEGQLLQ